MTNNENPEKEVTREEVVVWYKDQIELATLRADLAEQQARAAKSDAERMQATMFLAQAQAKPTMIGWFVGMVMKETGGKANPQAVNDLLKAKLGI